MATYQGRGQARHPRRGLNGAVALAAADVVGDSPDVVVGIVENPDAIEQGNGLDQVILRRSPPAPDLRLGNVVASSSSYARCHAVDVDGRVSGADKNSVGRVSEFARPPRDARPGCAGVRALEAERIILLQMLVDVCIDQGAGFELARGIVVAAKALRDGISVVEV